MKIYIVMTERKYEGSWITKIFEFEEDALEYLEIHKDNNELVIHEYEVLSSL